MQMQSDGESILRQYFVSHTVLGESRGRGQLLSVDGVLGCLLLGSYAMSVH